MYINSIGTCFKSDNDTDDQTVANADNNNDNLLVKMGEIWTIADAFSAASGSVVATRYCK